MLPYTSCDFINTAVVQEAALVFVWLSDWVVCCAAGQDPTVTFLFIVQTFP